MPIPFYRCGVCKREFETHDKAVLCELAHLKVVSATVKGYGIHQYPYTLNVLFSNGETREYVALEIK
jgi:transposase-like protein